jgi:hypothetical protein
MHNHYNLIPANDVRKDEETILEVLTAVKNNKVLNDIKLLNYYREVPINFGASIDHIEQGMVEMTVHQLQAGLMQLQKETLIRSSHFKHDVVAKVNRAEPEKRFAFLNSFYYAEILADRRANVRVEVNEHIETSFCAGQFLLQGKIEDISIGGIAIIAPERVGFNENTRGEIDCSLRGNRLHFPATLLRAVDAPPQKKFVFQFTPDKKSEEIISHFVFQTQSEIIRELKEKIL